MCGVAVLPLNLVGEDQKEKKMLQVAVLCLGTVGAVISMLVNSHLPAPYMVGHLAQHSGCPQIHTHTVPYSF